MRIMFRTIALSLLCVSLSHAGLKTKTAGILRSLGLKSAAQLLTESDRPPALVKKAALSKRSASRTCSVGGTVLMPDGTTPAEDYLTVSVIDTFGVEAGYGYTYDGSFSIDGLYPGWYTISCDAGDSTKKTWNGNTANWHSAQWFRLADGQSMTGRSIVLLPGESAPPATITVAISGTCYEGTGTATPLADAELVIRYIGADEDGSMPYFSDPDEIETATDGLGRFMDSLTVVPGSCYILVRAEKYGQQPTVYAMQWTDGTPANRKPTPVTVSTHLSGLQIHFQRGASISGAVTFAESGGTFGYATVYAVGADGFQYASASVTSPLDSFSLDGLCAGTYYVKVESWSGYQTVYFPAAADYKNATGITLAAGEQRTNVNLSLDPSTVTDADSSGTVAGSIVAGTDGLFPKGDVVLAYRDSSTYSQYAWVSDGTYELEAIYNTPFTLRFEPDASEYYYTRTWYPGTADPDSASTLTLTAPEMTLQPMSIVPGGCIGGFLTDGQGGPAVPSYDEDLWFGEKTGYWYVVYALNRSKAGLYGFTEISEMGGFRTTGLVPGSYDIRVVPYLIMGSDWREATASMTGICAVTASDITVTAGQTTVTAPITVTNGTGSISGTVGGTTVVYGLIYNQAGDLVSMTLNWGEIMSSFYPDDGRALFFGMDDAMYEDLYTAQVAVSTKELVFPGLPAGTYTVAAISYDVNLESAKIMWYGLPSQPYDMEDETGLFSNTVPQGVTWITVGEGQSVTGIDFGTIPVVNPAGKNVGAGEGLMVAQKQLGNTVAISYNLGKGSAPVTLNVISLDGRVIYTKVIDSRSGILHWDKKRSDNNTISNRTLIFVIKDMTKTYCKKVIIL